MPGVGAGCRLLVDSGASFLGTLAFQVGSSAAWDFPLPPWLPPLTLYFQDWYIHPLTNTIYSTRRLSVPIVK